MSHKHSQIAWDLPVESSTERLVLLALCRYANAETSECWPSGGTIAKITGLSKRAIWRSIKAFEKRQWLTRDSGNPTKTTRYKLTFSKGGSEYQSLVNTSHKGSAPQSLGSEYQSHQVGKEIGKEVGKRLPPQRVFIRELQPLIEKLTAKKERNRTGNLLTCSIAEPRWRTKEAQELDRQLTEQIKQLEQKVMETALA